MISKRNFGIIIKLSLLFVCECEYGYVRWENGEAVVCTKNTCADITDKYVAHAIYSNEINSTGWAFLELHTVPGNSDEKQAYAAGVLEGYLTRDLIWMHYRNVLEGYCFNKTDICGLIENYVDQNEEYVAIMTRDNSFDSYWYQIKLYYTQLEGLAAGYNAATNGSYQWLSVRNILWLNMMGDLGDLSVALSQKPPGGGLFGDHCSGLVKLLPDLSELYTAHVTWNSYQSMLRFQKMYVLHYSSTAGGGDRIPGYKMSFTSYPGFVQSMDDFYITSPGLVAAETTIGNTNQTLFEHVKPVGQILEFVRAMVAGRLARSGQEWVELFRRHNSGTYNNQWYIVDYGKFQPRGRKGSGSVRPGLLWVVEQLPGYTEAADLTHELQQNGYFPSYNIPYFPRVFNLSGGNERVAAYGDWFGYTTHPRAKMFHQLQGGVRGLWDMVRVMRYNDYRHDRRARCACRPPYSACNAIAARNDLNLPNGTYPFPALGHRSHGGTDAKVTSARLVRLHRFVGVASPAHNIWRGVPPFEWSKFDMGPRLNHFGHPNSWMFSPVIHKWGVESDESELRNISTLTCI